MRTTLTDQQERWNEIVADPTLRDLPYKVETNARGQIILSPHKAHHSHQQKALMTCLDEHLPSGEAFQEYPVSTPGGVKQADVIWASEDRQHKMRETGDPPILAPEICVEIMSASNTEEEMQANRELYRKAGAEEVWIVSEDGQIRFFSEAELEHSTIAPDAPESL
jgi:Uma2 family endonuclease